MIGNSGIEFDPMSGMSDDSVQRMLLLREPYQRNEYH